MTPMIDWAAAAIRALAELIKLVRSLVQTRTPAKADSPPPPPQLPPEAPTKERYQSALGKRHRSLREEILQLNPREMATLYGFEKVASLEDCEDGKDEFPTESMRRLENFFFINRGYLEGESTTVFRKVPLNKDACMALLRDDFRVYILTNGGEREPRMMHFEILFCKEENGFWRSVQATLGGYFQSTGGGKSNGMELIGAMVDCGLRAYQASVLRCPAKDWDRLVRDGSYYNKRMMGFGCATDHEAQDHFVEWFEEYSARRERYSQSG